MTVYHCANPMRLLSLLFAATLGVWAQSPSAYAITNVRIHPVNAPVIEKGTVLVRGGLIEDVGANVNIPSDSWLIDGSGLNLYPGLIDAMTSAGMPAEYQVAQAGGPRPGGGPPVAQVPAPQGQQQAFAVRQTGPEDRPATSSWVKASDVLNPQDPRIARLRDLGFTSAGVYPLRGIITGQGALVNLAGSRSGDMVVADSLGQVHTMRTAGFASYPGSLMGVIAYIRQVHMDAKYYAEQKQRYAANPNGMTRPVYDRALEGLLDSKTILLPGVEQREIERMIVLSKELVGKPILYGAHEAYLNANTIAAAKVPVLVDLSWPDAPRDPDPMGHQELERLRLRKYAPSSPAALAKAGVPFAFYTATLEQPGDAMKQVRKAISSGLSKEDALKALTLSPATIYGVADRLGTIEKGKIANLLVTRGELFDDRMKVEFVMIDGKKYTPDAAPPARPGGAPVSQGGVK